MPAIRQKLYRFFTVMRGSLCKCLIEVLKLYRSFTVLLFCAVKFLQAVQPYSCRLQVESCRSAFSAMGQRPTGALVLCGVTKVKMSKNVGGQILQDGGDGRHPWFKDRSSL